MSLHNQNALGNFIETGELVDLSVTEGKLAAQSVATAKIKDLNVTNGKIAADAVDDTKIADASIKIEHVTQTGRAALKFIRANAANTGLEFSSAAPTASDNITIEGVTMTLGEWLLI